MRREDDEDFREFVATRHAALLRTAYLMTGDRDQADDLVQSSLTRAYRHWERVRAAGDPGAYVRRIMLNERRSIWRRLGSRESAVAYVPERAGPDEASAYAERDVVWRALLTLPPRTRAVLVLRYWEDLSEATTAEILGCSAGTVKSLASRGLRRLERALGARAEGGAR